MRSVISVRKITAFKFPAPRLNFRDDSQWNFWCEISAMIFLRWNFHDEISAMEFPKWNFRGESYAILLQWNFQDEISAIAFPSWNFDCILIKKKHLPWNFPWKNYAVKYPTGKWLLKIRNKSFASSYSRTVAWVRECMSGCHRMRHNAPPLVTALARLVIWASLPCSPTRRFDNLQASS